MSPEPFSPTSAQRRLLDYIHENPSPLPTLGLCKSANVSRASFYRWCRDPNFRAWLGIAWSSRLLIDGIGLMNQARAQAPEKFSYWRALFDLTFDPKGLGTIAKWGESLVHLSPDAFIPGPDVKPKPKPKPPAGPRPQPDYVAELYKDSEFPPPPPPEIGPGGFPIYHPESVEEWNRRHGFVEEPGHKGPRLRGAGIRTACAAGRAQSNLANPVHTVLLLQRALNPRYPLRRRRSASRCASPVAKPGRRGPRLSGLEVHRERAAWRSHAGCPRLRNATGPQAACGLGWHREGSSSKRWPPRRPRSSRCATPVAKPGRRGPRLSGLEVHRERAAGRSPAGRPRLRNETVRAVPKRERHPSSNHPRSVSTTAPAQQSCARTHPRSNPHACQALSRRNSPARCPHTTLHGRHGPQRAVPGPAVRSQ